ncbi:MAG: class I SAM-dependent methyltransferase [Phycisphaerae bacterium]|nr:class I SAM-dependent methyltransferase [Phycisphaerae bacterium]
MDSKEQMAFFYEIFDASLPRLGPGDEASTIKALNMLRSTGPRHEDEAAAHTTRILDIGCGNGGPTITLARHTERAILAVDNHQPFLDELQRRAEAAGVSERIQVSLRDMRSLEKSEGPFDLIWSEGSLFVMGFREGLAACHSLLAPGGELAVSELCWLRSDPPADCRRFFATAYPALADIEASLAAIRACDYEVIGHFTLPESAWWEHYYHPLEERLRSLRKRYAADAEKLSMVESIQMEIDLYRQYSAFYGYVFFLMRRH